MFNLVRILVGFRGFDKGINQLAELGDKVEVSTHHNEF